MGNWRALKAARAGRDLRRSRREEQRLRAEVSAARNEVMFARRDVLGRLKQAAFSHLAGKTAEVIERVEERFLRTALEDIRRRGLDRLEVAANERLEDRTTVFVVRIPEAAYAFNVDLYELSQS